MEPYDPIGRLTLCCFGRRPRSGGFRTEALRNQYYYSPSMAHIGPGNTTTWPMAQPFCAPASFGPQPPPQPYILFATQPMIIAANPAEPSAQAQQMMSMGFGNMQQQQQQASPLHKVPSMATSQYAIYANSMCAATGPATGYTTTAIYAAQGPQFANATIYDSPKILNGLARNRTTYLGTITEAPGQQQAIGATRQPQQRLRGLNREIYEQLETIEKQVDLTRDMDLVERHGLVITRAIEASSLAPHLTDQTLRRYEEHFLMSDELYVIRFIEIIKRPGQTLGLYIRLVHFETQQRTQAKASREGIVITKIESNSPVYTSQVIHIGDEILSINLIDIQGMSLDDVVTLMSIPKRLVLALRIPRERDPQLRATHTLNRHLSRQSLEEQQQFMRARSVGQEESEFEYAQRARVAARQQFERHAQQQQQQARLDQTANQMHNLTSPLEGQEYQPVVRLGDRSPSGPRFARTEQRFVGSPESERTIMRPSDFISVSRSMQGEQSNTLAPSLGLSDKPLVQTNSILNNNDNEDEIAQDLQSHFSLANEPEPSARGQTVNGAARLLSITHFERQTAKTRPTEETHESESDRFRNFSVDNEIASLEREAMNKERHPMHTMNVSDRPMSFESDQNGTSGLPNAILFEHQPQGPRTLPRRTLPNRPELVADVGPLSMSTNRRPVINSIRLGETSEQSSYFSSSIDAINRELKELRRQRMALGDTESSVGEDTALDPKPLV